MQIGPFAFICMYDRMHDFMVLGKNVRGKNVRGNNVRGKNVRGNNVRGKKCQR